MFSAPPAVFGAVFVGEPLIITYSTSEIELEGFAYTVTIAGSIEIEIPPSDITLEAFPYIVGGSALQGQIAQGIGWESHWDEAVLTADNEAGFGPIGKTQSDPVGDPFQALSTSVTITADLGEAKPFRCLTLQETNLLATGTARVQLSNVAPLGSDVWDSGPQQSGVEDGYPHVWIVSPDQETARYITLTVENLFGDPPLIGRIWSGDLWVPPRRERYGRGIVWEDLSRKVRTMAGQDRLEADNLVRAFSFGWDFLPEETGMDTAFEIARVAGMTENMVVLLDRENHPQELSLMGILRKMPSQRWAPRRRRRVSVNYEIEQRKK